MKTILVVLALLVAQYAHGAVTPSGWRVLTNSRSLSDEKLHITAAVMPGDPLITGTISQGVSNGIKIYSNVMLLRFALSWFPQLMSQFPILRPVFTVTEPYLKVFRSQIPPIGGFDISAIPALFVLDILGQTAVAIGADDEYLQKIKNMKRKTI